jgi:type VI secretion system protein ImpK
MFRISDLTTMRPEIANLVHPVLSYGIRLKERLEGGERPDLESEQSVLKGLLLSDNEARRWADYGGEGPSGSPVSLIGATRMGESGRRSGDHFLGIRYALACWLDEIFILDSPYSSQWNERKLEVALYGTNDRAWKMWDQAKRAEARSGSDALEVFFLCVMLGFRGDLRDQPDKLQAWVGNTQARIAKSQGQEWPVPAELDPPSNVPPLHGREQLQRVVLTGGGVLLVLIPIVAFLIVQQLFR